MLVPHPLYKTCQVREEYRYEEEGNRTVSYQPIENYGIIGNMRTVALVGMNGSIDWYCYPFKTLADLYPNVVRSGADVLVAARLYARSSMCAPTSNWDPARCTWWRTAFPRRHKESASSRTHERGHRQGKWPRTAHCDAGLPQKCAVSRSIAASTNWQRLPAWLRSRKSPAS